MDDFAKLDAEEHRPYFEQTAAGLGLSATLIEKDFWVCWTLRRMFELEVVLDHLIFKGGTSLSKVYRVIERFSEDIDLSVARERLGFGGDDDPERAPSRKQQKQRIRQLMAACSELVTGAIRNELAQSIEKQLGTAKGWSLDVDPDDGDQQTLIFTYPQAAGSGGDSYIASAVKIELGARSDNFPTERMPVTPYVAEQVDSAMANPLTEVVVMTAERTFWEKMTILHKLHHRPAEKAFPLRMSRHYYDVYRLANSEIAGKATVRLDLLARVREHKQVFFQSAWAHYETAVPGTIRLSPPPSRLTELRNDYDAMAPMFFHEPPAFEEILRAISQLESQVNRGD